MCVWMDGYSEAIKHFNGSSTDWVMISQEYESLDQDWKENKI